MQPPPPEFLASVGATVTEVDVANGIDVGVGATVTDVDVGSGIDVGVGTGVREGDGTP